MCNSLLECGKYSTDVPVIDVIHYCSCIDFYRMVLIALHSWNNTSSIVKWNSLNHNFENLYIRNKSYIYSLRRKVSIPSERPHRQLPLQTAYYKRNSILLEESGQKANEYA